MKTLTMVAFGSLALAGCAGTRISKPVVCDGKHRRPANLYGTILPTLPVPLPASQGGNPSMAAPGRAPAPDVVQTPSSVPLPSPSLDNPGSGSAVVPAPSMDRRSIQPAPQTSQVESELSYSC
ncbi:MAG: hypothetical protein ABW128_21655 [Rhizorhabdus sp.]